MEVHVLPVVCSSIFGLLNVNLFVVKITCPDHYFFCHLKFF